MKAIITGASGTVGSVLRAHLEKHGIEVVPWDRGKVPVDEYAAMESFVRAEKPDYFFHLAVASKPSGIEDEGWKINYEWPSELAWITRMLHIPFLVTSTAMVYKDGTTPPLTPDVPANAGMGYGYEKRKMEQRVRYQNPDAFIVRLGWQIGTSEGSNSMTAHFDRQTAEGGRIEASTRWLPACSFLEDTAEALVGIISKKTPGLYMLDSNVRWNFYEIACALKTYMKKSWEITSVDNFVFDQRLIDPRAEIQALDVRLTDLS